MNKISSCVDPHAPVHPCVICDTPVFTCERKESLNNSYLCPVHPNGIETRHGLWVCSDDCHEEYSMALSPENLTESEKERFARLEELSDQDEYLAQLDSSLVKYQTRLIGLVLILSIVALLYAVIYTAWLNF